MLLEEFCHGKLCKALETCWRTKDPDRLELPFSFLTPGCVKINKTYTSFFSLRIHMNTVILARVEVLIRLS